MAIGRHHQEGTALGIFTKTPAARKVFGIGWAKTGTTTLGACLKTLGFRHKSQDLNLVADVERGDLSRIMALAARKDSFDDWPWIVLYRQLDETFPGSRFVLTTRQTAPWLKSYRNMLEKQGKPTDKMNRIRTTLYQLPFPDVTDDQLITRYESHNADVRAFFASRPADLLVVDWAQGDGWPELCGFLDLPVPSRPFPHANRGKY
jgi:hypothetical protein